MWRRRRARDGRRKEKEKNRRPILKMLCAALLRSFRGQDSEKMKGSTRGKWDPRVDQQPFRPNPNGAGNLTTTIRRLLIGADSSFGQLAARNIVLLKRMANFDFHFCMYDCSSSSKQSMQKEFTLFWVLSIIVLA